MNPFETAATPKREPVPFLPPTARWTSAAARTALGAAGAAVAFGGVYVLSVWRRPGNPAPQDVFPFTYATAVALGLLGLSAALLAGRRWRAAFLAGAFVAAAGLAGAGAEFLGIDPGADRFFGLGAALGLTAAGLCAAFLALGTPFGVPAALSAASLLALATAGLAGHVFSPDEGAALGWTRMAPGTGAAFAALGAAFLFFAGYRPEGLASRRLQWVPETAGLAALLFTIIAWQALRAGEWLAMGAQVAAQSARLRDSLLTELDFTATTLERHAKRWDFYGAQSVERQFDSALLLADFPTLRALAWVDARGAVLGAMPRAERTRAAAWAKTFPPAQENGPRARRVDLDGRPAVLLYTPLNEGFSLGAVDLSLAAQRVWNRLDIAESFGVAVEDAVGPVLVQGPRVPPARERGARLDWRGLSWSVKLWRQPGALPALPLSTLGFLLGLVFSGLVYESALLSRRLRRRAAQLHALREELAEESVRRAAAERHHEEKKHLLQLTSSVLAGREQSLGMALREVTESRDRLRALAAIVESSEDAIIGKNEQAIVTSWNGGAEKMYGYRREEIIGKSVTLLAPPEHSDDVRQLTQRVFRGETIKNFETVRVRKDGRRIDVSLGISPIRDATGAVIAASVVARDVTEKNRAEETLRRNESLIREVLESLPVGLSIADETGAIVTQNQKMRELWAGRGIIDGSFGAERKGWWADTGRPLASGDWPLSRAVAQGETSLGNVIEIEGWDGVRKTLVCNAVPLRDIEGKLLGGIEVQEDITEKRRAEQALALHSVILRNMKEGVCLVRASDAVIVYTNPKFEEMYGYSPGELMGLEAKVLNHGGDADAQKVWRRVTEALVQGGEAVYELHSRKKNGAPFWCAAHTSEFTHPTFGKVWVAVHEDITEKKTADNRLRQSLQEKEVLLQEVHHRVKNNMQIISSLLQLQSQHIKNPRVLQVVQESRGRIRSMALIHEKLYRSGDLARVQFGDYCKSLANDVVRSFSTVRTPTVKLDIVPVEMDLDTAIPLGLLVNELVSNAVKHAFPNKDDGEILVELKSAEPRSLTLRVKDNGVGFLHAPPADGEENASFGLRLVRILSEQLGGKAELKSGPGVEFRTTFPLSEKSALQAGAAKV